MKGNKIEIIGTEEKVIRKLKEEIIDIDFNKFYKKWNDNFDEIKGKDSKKGFEYENLKELNPKILKLITDKKCLLGIDLPIFIRNKSNRKSLFILAQDPLRANRDFEKERGKIILGTPFALHSDFYRNQRTKIYWNIIKRAFNEGYNIYITDVMKIWIENLNLKNKKYELYDVFIDILKIEFEKIKPDKILLMGNVAEKAVESFDFLENNRKIIVPHPRARSSAWEEKGLKKFDEESIENFIIRKTLQE